ncbi:hypothetical protein ABZ477_08460 [Microbacterium sp. NPDC019599]|uniref:hypothetical protein n=1 Tax=Microbacterium sp. NPDC019599 TaxID=3154690 RepID=UPI0033D619CC
MSFYIHYPDDWIGVPQFGDGEVFATPRDWATALVAEIAPAFRPKPRRRQRAALVDALALLGGSVQEIGAQSGYIWIDTLETAPFLVGSIPIPRSEVGDAPAVDIAGGRGDGDYVPPIVRDVVTDSGVPGVYVERHAPLDDRAVHVANLIGTYVFEVPEGFLMLGTSTTDFTAFERFRPHFEELARTVRWED